MTYCSEGILRSTINGASLGIKRARGIVVDEEREVMYVDCSETNKIIKATLVGECISTVSNKGSGNLSFSWPIGMCQDAANNIYVADSHNKRVQVLGPDCSYIKEIKCKDFAIGVAVDFHGEVHVAAKSGVEVFGQRSGYSDGV